MVTLRERAAPLASCWQKSGLSRRTALGDRDSGIFAPLPTSQDKRAVLKLRVQRATGVGPARPLCPVHPLISIHAGEVP